MPLPRDYSGNAFRQEPQEKEANEEMPPVATPITVGAQEAAPPDTQNAKEESPPPRGDDEENAAPAGAFWGEKGHSTGRGGLGSLFSGASSLLSALLPPARGAKKRKESWSEWIVIGIALLLFLNDDVDDLLPLLLLLLLWD